MKFDTKDSSLVQSINFIFKYFYLLKHAPKIKCRYVPENFQHSGHKILLHGDNNPSTLVEHSKLQLLIDLLPFTFWVPVPDPLLDGEAL